MCVAAIAEGTLAFDFQGTNTSEVRIGSAKDRPEYMFHGAIDEVKIYNRALSGTEIAEAMAGTSGVEPLEKLATTVFAINPP